MRTVVAALLILATAVIAVHGNAFDDYVHAPDSNYAWTELTDHTLNGTGLIKGQSWTGYTINMTSQRWLTDNDFADNSPSKSLWWHILVVIVPNEVTYTRNSSMYITGGGNDGGGSLPKADDEDIVVGATLAMWNKIIVGVLFQIPNQHVIFRDDPKQERRSEDAVIAYTWDHFHRFPDQPEWLLRFPMTKASLRGMDTIKAFAAQKLGPMYSLDYFSVAGASKRGWTTWMVGAVDAPRTVAIIPIVLDAINFVKVMHHQYRSYGNWSFALKDYAQMDFMNKIDDPTTLAMQKLIDPYFYFDRLTMPKFIVNALMDEFQQPDDTHYWWNDLPEPKHFLICPNAEHSEATGVLEIVPAIVSFQEYLLRNTQPVPTFTWDISEATGEITATLDNNGVVHKASLWAADSCGNNADGTKRRDFRVVSLDNPCKCGLPVKGLCANLVSLWYESTLNVTMNGQGQRQYKGVLPARADGGWTAWIIMIEYENPFGQRINAQVAPPQSLMQQRSLITKRRVAGLPPIPIDIPNRLVFTTEVSVWPQSFPYSDCSGLSCGNGLC